MEKEQAFKIVIREGSTSNGMVIETRAGIDPGVVRVHQLQIAVETVLSAVSEDSKLDRKLASALFGLSFHMSETLNHWNECEWIEDYIAILSAIELIFDNSTK